MSGKPILLEEIPLLGHRRLLFLVVARLGWSPRFEDQLAMFWVFLDIFFLLLCNLLKFGLELLETSFVRSGGFRTGLKFDDFVLEVL